MSNIYDYLTGRDYKINGVLVRSSGVSNSNKDRFKFTRSSPNYRNKDLELFLQIYNRRY